MFPDTKTGGQRSNSEFVSAAMDDSRDDDGSAGPRPMDRAADQRDVDMGQHDVETALAAPSPAQVETMQPRMSAMEALDDVDTMGDDESDAPGPSDMGDIYFLIANFLRRATPCSRTAAMLEDELHSLGLLDSAVDWQGRERPATFTDVHLRHRQLPPTHLVQLLRDGARKNETTLLKPRPPTPSTPDARRSTIQELILLWLQMRENERKILRVERLLEKFATTGTDIAEEQRGAKQLRFLQRQLVQDKRKVDELLCRVRDWGMAMTKPFLGHNHARVLLQRERSGRSVPMAHFAASSARRETVPIFAYTRYRILKTLSGHLQISVYCVTFDKSGTYIITGSDDRLVKIWSARTGDLLYTLHGHVGNITDMDINDDGSLLVTSSDDKTVRVWEIATGFAIAVLVGHTSVVNTVRFHPHLNVVVSASDDGHCLLFRLPRITQGPRRETKTETVQRLFQQHAYCLNIKPFLVLGHVPSTNTTRVTRACKVLCLDVSPCGTKIATGSQDGVMRLWHVGPHVLSSTAATSASTQAQIDAVVASIPDANPEPLPEVRGRRRRVCATANVVVGDTDGADRTESAVVTEPSLVLTGHTSPITNVFFSKHGESVATQSIKDGTTRLWQLPTTSRPKLGIHILSSPETVEGGRRQGASWSADMMMWTAHGDRLVTLHSRKADATSLHIEQAIRIWDPTTFALVMTLRHPELAHVNAVFAMEVHPIDWRILLTAGYDGRICLWDISAGTLLRQYQNRDSVGDPCPILDMAFSPTGDLFAVTDRVGRLCIFGTGAGDSYKASPRDQYFANDYAPIEMDVNLNVRDRDTQVQPHLLPRSALMDMSRSIYAQQPLHLMLDEMRLDDYVTNRAARVAQYLELYQANLEGIVRSDENAHGNYEPFPNLIETVTPKSVRGARGALATTQSYRVNGAPVLASEVRAPVVRRVPRDTDDRDRSVLDVVLSSDEDRDEDFQVPATANGDDDDDDDDDDAMGDLVDEESDAGSGSDTPPRIYRTADGSRALRSRRRSSADDDEPAPRRRRLRKRNQAQILDGPSSGEDDEIEQRMTVTSPARVSPIHDDDDELDDDGMQGAVVESTKVPGSQRDVFDTTKTFAEMLAAKRRVDPGAQILCGFCGRGDVAGMTLPGETLGVHPLVNGSQRVFVHDPCAITSPQSFYDDDGHWYNIAKELRRGRLLKCNLCDQKGATLGCNYDACTVTMHFHCALATGWKDEDTYYCGDHVHLYVPSTTVRNDPLRAMKAQLLTTQVAFEEGYIKRIGLRYDRLYCQQVTPQPQTYVPQVGDLVVYCPQGHEFYLRFHPSKTQPAYMKFPRKVAAVQCQIVHIAYTFPLVETYKPNQRVLMQLHLEVVALPAVYFEDDGTDADPCRRAFNVFVPVNDNFELDDAPSRERRRFRVHMQPSHCPDFIVLFAKYALGFGAPWNVQDAVQTVLPTTDDHGIQIDAVLNMGTVLASDRADPDVDSPWECLTVLFDDDGTVRVSPWELEPASAEARLAQLALAPPVPSIEGERRAGLLRALASIMQLSVALDFVPPVPESTPDYYVTVANPMDLSLIRSRVELGYYRQVDALLADVQLILDNCEKYNVETSPIAQNARALVAAMVSILQPLFPREVAAWQAAHVAFSRAHDEAETLETKRPPKRSSSVDGASPNPKRRCTDDAVVVQKLRLSVAQRQQWLQRLAKGSLASHLSVLHRAIQAEDAANIFASPVTDDIAPGYSVVIPHPMDFGTMQAKLSLYGSFAAYYEDFMLVCANATVYNEAGSYVHSEAVRMKGALSRVIGTILKGKAKAGGAGKKRRPRRDSFDMNEMESDEESFASSENDDDDDDEPPSDSSSSSSQESSDEAPARRRRKPAKSVYKDRSSSGSSDDDDDDDA
ncbi:hypothetical protein SPRG_12989 [Saprolegnia parasitica CBS 223.65]|uniref:Bromodomain and WD repeat-containing protein 1 n=1 Tax=Saprolegnia parasitica (strain CBS 223.65) TaxID=695850 RepID=A0A067C1G3_SAPPC|nr:hypothetical protein SPRG_12989 [Saprolegnia parasitica CBS 223.65]KDO20632.1 hypothetical protein SPRG_12989 [Saprolegnia parasitica CBS 223.65]|eukprot:XP_012208686.1 hypothetical protein SPRG_12989 [Saprolegnia parasitica CBS 223.65]